MALVFFPSVSKCFYELAIYYYYYYYNQINIVSSLLFP